MMAHYECADCKKLFAENKAETDAESLIIPAFADNEAVEPETTEPAPTEPEATDSQSGGGCSSSFGGIALALTALLGGALIIKKKEGK